MAISPNDTFTSGQILTAAECNAFPFGVCALATSTTSYVLTASSAIATGMTVTFTAIANRYYKITYYEPQVETPAANAAFTSTNIKVTNAAGTSLQGAICQTTAAQKNNSNLCNIYVGTFAAGSTTIVGCSNSSVTTGAPQLSRSATIPAFILVEDLGPA